LTLLLLVLLLVMLLLLLLMLLMLEGFFDEAVGIAVVSASVSERTSHYKKKQVKVQSSSTC
jgi:hypothetical protein